MFEENDSANSDGGRAEMSESKSKPEAGDCLSAIVFSGVFILWKMESYTLLLYQPDLLLDTQKHPKSCKVRTCGRFLKVFHTSSKSLSHNWRYISDNSYNESQI